MRGFGAWTARRWVHQVFRGQSRPLERSFPRRWDVPQAWPRTVSVMIIQFVRFKINNDKGLERLGRTKMGLWRRGFVNAVLRALEIYVGSSCANVNRRRTCDVDLVETEETAVFKSFDRVAILGYYQYG